MTGAGSSSTSWTNYRQRSVSYHRRVLVPVMAKLPDARLNLLGAEALGTAVILDVSIRVAAVSQQLRSACEGLGVELVVGVVG